MSLKLCSCWNKSLKGKEEENEFESYAAGYLFQDREEILIAIDIDFSVSPNVKTIK